MSRAEVVTICGPPCSGNKLVRGLLMEKHGYRDNVRILHYGIADEWEAQRRLAGDKDHRCVIMLRDDWAHAASLQRAKKVIREMPPAEHHARHWRPTLLAAAGLPMLPVRYEDLVADPDRWGQKIVEFLGCGPWGGWHVPIFNANAKYRCEPAAATPVT